MTGTRPPIPDLRHPTSGLFPWEKGCGDGGLKAAFGLVDGTRKKASAPWRMPPSPRPRKEVIQPQVPLRLPCYDFAPVADLTVVGCPPSLGQQNRLRVKPTPMA
jgi:hypothetical protein